MDRGQSRRCLDAVEIYNPDGDYWRDGPPLPCAQLSLRTNASNAGVVGGKIYVCGYYKEAGKGKCLSIYTAGESQMFLCECKTLLFLNNFQVVMMI